MPANKIKDTSFSLVDLLFHIEVEGKCGWIIGGGRAGGAKCILPPSPCENNWGGRAGLAPCTPPMNGVGRLMRGAGLKNLPKLETES